MPPHPRYNLMLEALVELTQQEVKTNTLLRPALPVLQDMLAQFKPLPAEALFIAVASDGLPLLLDLHDPLPGPIMIIADAGAGKTHFLQVIARGAEELHSEERLNYGVITAHPEEWKDFGHSPLLIDIFPAYHNSAQEYLLSLASWAYSGKHRQSNLLLIDDLESVLKLDFEARQAFRWLLLRGTAHNVWTIITLNPEFAEEKDHWLELCKTRFFGHIGNQHLADLVTNNRPAPLDSLTPFHFVMSENGQWLEFWLPSLK